MSIDAMLTVGRNDPCPCGSRMRFKECHGSIAASIGGLEASTLDVGQTLTASSECLASSDIAGARSLAEQVLGTIPGHPVALRILGRCDYELGNPSAGLTNLLKAARSMKSMTVDATSQYAIWTDLGFLFAQTLSGMDVQFAIAKRQEYATFVSGTQLVAGSPRVSVVVLLTGQTELVRQTLESVRNQSYQNIQLVVVDDGVSAEVSRQVDVVLQSCSFPSVRVTAEGADMAGRANAGVLASSGAFVNVLEAGDRFSRERIAAMVTDIANRGTEWGFSNVEFTSPANDDVKLGDIPLATATAELLSGIQEADTVGFALLHQNFVAAAIGNLFFARRLYDVLGGFVAPDEVCAWDFGLRAVWHAEPIFVPSSHFTRHLAGPDASSSAQVRREGLQLAVFREFYENACSDVAPPNVFAPSLAHWRYHFLKTPFQIGHVLAFSLDRLEALGAAIVAKHDAAVGDNMLSGLNLVGFAFGEFGLAENLRALANACLSDDIPFAIKDVDLRLKTRQADRSLAAHVVDELQYKCSLFCMNPDLLKPVSRLMKPRSGAHRYNIGFWFWELEQIPTEWQYGIDAVDEIWVATEFIADAMRRATSKPVTKIPTPIEVRMSGSYSRADFGLPDNRFLFLFSFDFNSFVARKNPEGAIRAFKRAFADGRHDAGLVVKAINGANQPAKLRQMRELIGDDPRIVIVDRFLTRDQVFGLQSVVDAYVSLHRAEGLGLGLAESMYLGKPVVGTAYSGNLEFMNEDNSCLVGYTLVPVAKGEYLYDDERFRWAEPDEEHAASWMRRLVDDPRLRQRIALKGQEDMRTKFNNANAAALIRKRLREIGVL
ncbi:MAG: glycosyltransferase [Betaproteobacteria bacterium]